VRDFEVKEDLDNVIERIQEALKEI